MFGRNGRGSSSSTTSLSRRKRAAPGNGPESSVKEGGKGHPTRKRSEAERGRRKSVMAPRDRKEAYREVRRRNKADRGKQMEALKAGDERALPSRDRGPVRKYVRDLVDSRRSVAEFFLPLALVILALTMFGTAQLKLFGGTLWLVLVVLLVIDSVVLAYRLRRGLQRTMSGEPHRGAMAYGLMRSMQIRRFRLPPPRMRTRGRNR